MNRVIMAGCSPEPIMMNLKALGIFRVIAEQEDPDAAASWENDKFVLHTRLSKDEMREFFLTKYCPTPIVSPWNGGSGFLDLDGSKIDEVENTTDPRLSGYAQAVRDAKRILEQHVPEYRKLAAEYSPEYAEIKDRLKATDNAELKAKLKSKKKAIDGKRKALVGAIADQKSPLMRSLRNEMDDRLVPWFDSMFAVTHQSDTEMGVLLGTYGNDGNFEMSYNFLDCVTEIISDRSGENVESLNGALFGDDAPMGGMSNAYFYPGGYGGANSSSKPDFPSRNFTNRWDYVLCLEGTILFAGNVSRRSNAKKAAFPFTVSQTMAGYGTAADEKTRGEIWIPMWDRPTTYRELKYVFSEGRSHVGTRQSATGTDFARALASLGVQRGVGAFQRFGIMERKGQAYMCANIGRYASSSNSSTVNPFTDLDAWLSNIRKARNKPKHIDELLRRIDGMMLRFCASGQRRILEDILVAVGHTEQSIAHSSLRGDVEPLQRLSQDWVINCSDNTPEFRLAVALGSMGDTRTQYHVRHNLEPIMRKKSKLQWASSSPRCVWTKVDTMTNMINVLERRCVDANIAKTQNVPLKAKVHARVSDVARLLNDESSIDYTRLGNLIHPMSMIEYENVNALPPNVWNHNVRQDLKYVPETYVCSKSNITPMWKRKEPKIKLETSIIRLLKSGKVEQAAHVARRRLHISGISTAVYSSYKGMQTRVQSDVRGYSKRLAASLLFPVQEEDVQDMVESVKSARDKRLE